MSKPSQRRICLKALILGPVVGSGLAEVAIAGSACKTPKRHKVRIVGAAFEPASIAIKRGEHIRFVNDDIVPHTATAIGENPSWDTGILNRSEHADIAFNTPGEHSYFCTLHPSMKARVSVV